MTAWKRKGSKVYQLQFTPDGYPHEIRRTSGGATSKRVAEAIEGTLNRLGRSGAKGHAILDRIRAGELTPLRVHGMIEAGRTYELFTSFSDPPLKDRAEAYLASVQDPRARYAIQRLLAFAPEDARVSWLADPEHLEAFAAHYRAEGYAATTEIREMSNVRQLIRRELGEEGVERLRQVPLRKPPKKRMRYLERDEIERVRKACGPEWWRVFGLYMACGLRRMELVRLQVRDVNLSGGYVTVAYGKTRRAERKVPLRGETAEILSDWIAEQGLASSDPLFPGLTRDNVYKAWREIRAAAGVEDATIHSLRHTFGVHNARAGVPIPTLQVWMGHAKIETTMIYARFQPAEPPTAHSAALASMGLAGEETPKPRLAEEREA